jgi:hypothetical protein
MLPYSPEYKYQIFTKAKIGFEFEFYSDLSERNIATIFKNTLGKKIVLGRSKKSFSKSKSELGYHTNVPIDDNTFKLEKDYSGGPMMYELVTSPLSYFESKKILTLTLQKIKEIGWVNDLSGIHVNISFTDKDLDVRFINILKFCVNFEDIEKSIFKDFPTRKKNIYTESITKILPDYSTLTDDITFLNIYNSKINLPVNSRYFGVNFQHLNDGYLEFRYLGGRDYVKKSDKIIEYFETFIIFTYDQCVNRGITESDNINFTRLVSGYYEKMKHFKSYETFKKAFPNIYLSVDLKYDDQFIIIKFNQIKELLYNLIVNNNIRDGYINWDSDSAILQVKDSKMERGIDVERVEFISCELSGVFDNCSFYNCIIKSSMLYGGSLSMSSEVEDSKVLNVKSNETVLYKKSFIRNDISLLSGMFEGCVVVGDKQGLSQNSTYDDQTIFIDKDTVLGKKKK